MCLMYVNSSLYIALIVPTKGNGFDSDRLLAATVVFCDSKRL